MDGKTKQKPQIERFREKAKELECDEDDEAFRSVVRKVAITPSKKAKSSKRKKAQ